MQFWSSTVRKHTLFYFSKDAYAKLKGDNKELLIIPDAVHTDLYDNTDIIPFDKIEVFMITYLNCVMILAF